jgi:hypothetical protein
LLPRLLPEKRAREESAEPKISVEPQLGTPDVCGLGQLLAFEI